MLRAIEPKNARSKRAMDRREPKLIENVKQALFVPGLNFKQVLHDAFVDLSALKKPDAKRFSQKNDIKPFEDASSLEFFSSKNDASLLVFGSHNKKRPYNLTFVRTFDYTIYDIIELQLQQFKFLKDFKKQTFNVGMKPLFTFQGPLFDSDPTYMHIKSLFLDFFRGQTFSQLDVTGLQHVISISAGEKKDGDSVLPTVFFRVYLIKTYKSSTGPKLPRVELEEIGPRFDFKIGRVQSADPDREREAMKRPRQLEPKTKKNVETDIMGDKVARIHVGKQDLGSMQVRKTKALKAARGEKEDGARKKQKTM